MKILHFSDTHLGYADLHKVDGATGINRRELDVYEAFTAVVDHAIETKPDLVVHAGDLFHTPRPNNRALAHALAGFKRVVDAQIPVVVIAGNHSTPRLAASGSIFSALEVVGVHAAYEPKLTVFEVAGCEVHCIPHMPTEEMMKEALAGAHRTSDIRPAILITHAGVKSTGGAFSMSEFNELVLDEKGVAHLGEFDYVALGHYHKHLKVAPNAYYSGSTERFHKNEAAYDKGFVEVEVEVGAPGPKLAFHALEPRRMVVVDAVDCSALEAPEILTRTEGALSKAAPLDGAIVYLNLESVTPGAWINLDRAAVRAAAGDALHVEIDHEIAASSDGGSRGASIGKLTDEFAAFLQRVTKKGEVPKDVRALADTYLRELLEEGAS